MIDGVTDDLLAAGAIEVVGTVAITEPWTDPGEIDVLDGLVAQLTQEDIELPDGTAYDRAAVLLASALVGPQRESEGEGEEAPRPRPPRRPRRRRPTPSTEDPQDGLTDNEINTILEGLRPAGSSSYDGAPTAVADLAVVVAPPAPGGRGRPHRDRERGLDPAGHRARRHRDRRAWSAARRVRRGRRHDRRAARRRRRVRGGVDRRLRRGRPGQIATVVALAAELNGQTGHYGQVGDVDGPIAVLTAEAG